MKKWDRLHEKIVFNFRTISGRSSESEKEYYENICTHDEWWTQEVSNDDGKLSSSIKLSTCDKEIRHNLKMNDILFDRIMKKDAFWNKIENVLTDNISD